MKLKGKVILITGGSRRLGFAIAQSLAKAGARIAISYLSSAPEAKKALRKIEEIGPEAVAIRADISRAKDVKRLIDTVASRFGAIDVLINNAANFKRTPFKNLTERDWDSCLDTNLKGTFLCSLYASKIMLRLGGGKIINIADWAGLRPYRDYLPYCVSKAAVLGLTQSLAKELSPLIQVNAIAPGPVLAQEGMSRKERARAIQRLPLKRWGSPQDIANTALFLIEGTDFMTGSVIFVDGGRLIA